MYACRLEAARRETANDMASLSGRVKGASSVYTEKESSNTEPSTNYERHQGRCCPGGGGQRQETKRKWRVMIKYAEWLQGGTETVKSECHKMREQDFYVQSLMILAK